MKEFKVGDKLRDNDPRMPNRVLTIIQVYPDSVAAEDGSHRAFVYSQKRIHADGKPRRSGLSLVLEDATK